MVRYYHAVDKRSRRKMAAFLSDHFRYDTMRGWNGCTSYAHNMKIQHLGLDSGITNKLFDLIEIDEFGERMANLRHRFAEKHNYLWQAGMNGRSGGYLVLYRGGLEPSGYKSFCTSCGQMNCTSVVETGPTCGKCKAPARIDYPKVHRRVVTYPGKGVDQHEDFLDWSMDELRDRVELVQSFDELATKMVLEAITIATTYSIEEESYLVEKTRRVMVPAV